MTRILGRKKFWSEITLCCKSLKTQGKFHGWVFGTISATGSSVPRETNQLVAGMYPKRWIDRGAVMNASTRAVILVSATSKFARLDAERVRAALRLRAAARPATRADASRPQHPLA